MKKIIPSLLTLVLFLLYSCKKSENIQPEKQMLKLNFAHEPKTLDPRKGGDVISSTAQFMLFEGLTRLNNEGQVENAIAESISISDDKTEYTFVLKNTFWSNGDRLKATDFEYSWKKILDPTFPSPNANLLYPIKNARGVKEGVVSPDHVGIKALNDYTLFVKLEHPTPYFLELISFCVFFPVNQWVDQNNPNWAKISDTSFVSNGPFLLQTWKRNHEFILIKNPTYWDRDNVYLDKIYTSFITDENTALQMYSKGDLDFLGTPISNLPLDSLPNLSKENELKFKPVGASSFCSFNVAKFPFSNKNMRKAFSIALHRKAIVENIAPLEAKIPPTFVPPVLFQNILSEKLISNDLVLAEKHLNLGMQELGIKLEDLQNIVFSYPRMPYYHNLAQAVQDCWLETLGIKIKLDPFEYNSFLDIIQNKDYQVGLFSWAAQYNDAMNILERFKYKHNPKNYPGWENEEYIKLLDLSNKQSSAALRTKFLKEAESIILEELPLAPILHWNYWYLQKEYAKNIYISPIGSIHFRSVSIQKEAINEN